MYRKKWTPSAAQRRDFAKKMENPAEREAYEQRKRDRADKRRAASQFNYGNAGGSYVPTKEQFEFCLSNWPSGTTSEQDSARDTVMYGYTCQEKVHHDYIHIVNEMRRSTY